MEDMKKLFEDIDFVKSNVNDAALYEGLAEEATEVAKESLKIARILRKENPTPASFEETKKNLVSEIEDFQNYVEVLELGVLDLDSCSKKMERWVERIKKSKNENKEAQEWFGPWLG